MKKSQAFLIGLCQACALIQGLSRSAATIFAARTLNFKRIEAARFSFLLGTPAMCGATLLHFKEFLLYYQNADFQTLLASSFLVGILSIKFFLSFISKYSFLAFALYRLALALLISYILFFKI